MIGASTRPMMLAPNFDAHLARAAVLAVSGEKPSPQACRICDVENDRPYEVIDGIAIIPVSGMLVDKLGWIGSSWITGYDGLRYQFAEAFDDPGVQKIAMVVDSGGGMVSGCFDLCRFIVEGKRATKKPVAAICDDSAYSAAYAIASCADSIAVPQTGGVGSIGVISLHVDISKALDKFGETVTIIKSGSHKADGNPYEPLPKPVRDDWQAEVDDLRQLFASTVAANRGISVDAVLGTEARCYSGPSGTAEAVRLGLADDVLSPDAAFAEFYEYRGS